MIYVLFQTRECSDYEKPIFASKNKKKVQNLRTQLKAKYRKLSKIQAKLDDMEKQFISGLVISTLTRKEEDQLVQDFYETNLQTMVSKLKLSKEDSDTVRDYRYQVANDVFFIEEVKSD